MKKIGIVTVTYNGESVLDDFMSSIIKQNYQNWVLYVIDNNSVDKTIEKVTLYKNDKIKLIANDVNIGVAKGNNQGIINAVNDGCEYVLLINNDTYFDSNLIESLVDGMIALDIDVIAPKMMFDKPTNKIWFGGGDFFRYQALKLNLWGNSEIDYGQCDEIQISPFLSTCCALFKISVFEKVGLMDEKYFVYVDDPDWFYRAKCLNVKSYYYPKAVLFHKVSSSTGGALTDFTLKMYFRNTIYFLRKNTAGIYQVYSILYFISLTVLKVLINRAPRKKWKLIFTSICNGFKL